MINLTANTIELAMAKDTLYFSHDFGARNDPKMTRLRIKRGMAGIGAYWVLIEYSYEQGGVLSTDDIDEIADNLRCDCELLKSVINDFKLFEINGKEFYSKSVLNRLKIRREKSEKARESVNKRYKKSQNKNTNVSNKSTVVENIDSNVSENATINKRKESKEIKETTSPILEEDNEEFSKPQFDVIFMFLKQTKNYRVLQDLHQKNADDVDRYFERFFNEKIDIGELNNKSPGEVVKHFSLWLPIIIRIDGESQQSGKKSKAETAINSHQQFIEKFKGS